MFATLPKLADRNFVVGFLLPVLIASLAGMFLFRDTAAVGAIYDAVLHQKQVTDLTLVLISIWGVSVLLTLLNHQIYRLLEGYTWPLRRQRWLEKWQQRYIDEYQSLTNDHLIVYRTDNVIVSDRIKHSYFRRRRLFNEEFPNRKDLVLPTRLGNVIRAFESYPNKVYGADSIPIWLRLQALAPKDFISTVANVRAQLDFFINTLLFWLY